MDHSHQNPSHVGRKRLEDGMLRQMDIQNAMYPEKMPVIDGSSGVDPLEFSQLIGDNLPVVFKNACNDFAALKKWGPEYFRTKIGHIECKVAETPYGNADSPLGKLFIKPHVETMTVNELLDSLANPTERVRYMQSQDGNLPKEFSPLLDDIPEDIPWAKKAVGESAEAVNLWIGDSRTTSRLHNDNYENLFLQVTGSKTMYLIPPCNAYALDEQFLTDATYTKDFEIMIDATGDVYSHPNMIPQQLDGDTKIMFPTVNPADPSTFNRVYRQHCKVYKVDLNPGDLLYIPALWYHQVCITEGLSISANYWYPASTMRSLWTGWDYLRVNSVLIRGYHDPYFFDDSDDDELSE